jgi:hypothetical protein
MISSVNLPLSQQQGIYLGVIIIILVVSMNLLNGFMLSRKMDRNTRQTKKDLIDISRQLLTRAGYLKDE